MSSLDLTEPKGDRFGGGVGYRQHSEVDAARCVARGADGDHDPGGTVLDWNSPRLVSPSGELRARERGAERKQGRARKRSLYSFLGNVYAFSRDSRWLAVASSGQVMILMSTAALNRRLQGGSQEITSLAFASRRRLLAGYADGRLEDMMGRIWIWKSSLRTKRSEFEIFQVGYPGHPVRTSSARKRFFSGFWMRLGGANAHVPGMCPESRWEKGSARNGA
ncbi:MAG: hypothetical protein U1F77_18955 [Kiritimatiellia bacterium]